MLIHFPLRLYMDCVFSANVVQTVLSLRWLHVAIILGDVGQSTQGVGAALMGSTVYGQPARRKGHVFS